MNTFLRLLSYIVTRLTAVAIIVILIILAIFIGYDFANINVVVDDGLAKRTEAILNKEENLDLNKFYTQEYLDRDILLSKNPYEDFIIGDYDQRIKLKKLWVWPWETNTKVYVEEIVTHIEGSNKDEEQQNTEIPSWESGEKIILMEKDGRWRISNIILTKPIKPEEKNNNDQEE
ncbi:MAG TPA: hypothetical protein VFD57_02665 [Clostridia bacterium]|nr:hypothetical protein [Clostridia bacterium]